MGIIRSIAGDQVESAEDLARCIRMLLEDAAEGSLDFEPIPGVRRIEDHPTEFLVEVRMGSQRFRVAVTEETG